MNLKHLRKQLQTNLRLRPIALRFSESGGRLSDHDDFWFFERICDDPVAVELLNVRTHHLLRLQPDNVKEYRSPDFLLLRCQVIIKGRQIEIEPVYDNNATFVRLEHQMPELLAEMRDDLKEHPLRREAVLLKRSWSYWAKGNELVYYFDDHPDLLSKFQVLANNGLVEEITYNNVTRYLVAEDLARYLGA